MTGELFLIVGPEKGINFNLLLYSGKIYTNNRQDQDQDVLQQADAGTVFYCGLKSLAERVFNVF